MGKSAPEGRPGDGSSVSDEEWAEFLRAAGQADQAEVPRELSARERAARVESARLPEGWRTGPAWRDPNGRRTAGRRRAGSVLMVLLAVGLAVLAVRPELLTDRFNDDEDRGVASTPLPGETARPSSAPHREHYSDAPTLEEPFRGSPAVRWANGAAGIEVPEGKAVGGMTREQVDQALRSTKELLVSANLDRATVRGEQPEDALKLLEPLQPDVRGMLGRALSDPRKNQDPLSMFSRFDPAEVRLVGDVIKTRGRMTFEKGERGPGEVLVHADYTFVYPMVKARQGALQVERTIVRRQLTVALADPAKWQTTPGTLAVVENQLHISNSDCFTYDGFLHPVFDDDAATDAPSGPPVDPYDRSRDISDREGACRPVSRT